MTTVFFHRLAALEFRKARERYEKARNGLGVKFAAQVGKAIERIAEAPESWPIFRSNMRWVRVRRFSYILHFRNVSPGEVEILAVAHTSRRLGYWQRRSNRE